MPTSHHTSSVNPCSVSSRHASNFFRNLHIMRDRTMACIGSATALMVTRLGAHTIADTRQGQVSLGTVQHMPWHAPNLQPLTHVFGRHEIGFVLHHELAQEVQQPQQHVALGIWPLGKERIHRRVLCAPPSRQYHSHTATKQSRRGM